MLLMCKVVKEVKSSPTLSYFFDEIKLYKVIIIIFCKIESNIKIKNIYVIHMFMHVLAKCYS